MATIKNFFWCSINIGYHNLTASRVHIDALVSIPSLCYYGLSIWIQRLSESLIPNPHLDSMWAFYKYLKPIPILHHRGCILMLWHLFLPIVPMVSPIRLRGIPSLWFRIRTQIRCEHFTCTWNPYRFYTTAGAYWCFDIYSFPLFISSLRFDLVVIRVSDSESTLRFDVNILQVPETYTDFTPPRVHIDALTSIPSHCSYGLSDWT